MGFSQEKENNSCDETHVLYSIHMSDDLRLLGTVISLRKLNSSCSKSALDHLWKYFWAIFSQENESTICDETFFSVLWIGRLCA